MNESTIYLKLARICGSKKVSKDPKILMDYSEDLSFFKGKAPKFVVWPSNAQEIEKILKMANKENLSIIPVSSSSKNRRHGDTIPIKDDSVILNLSIMKKIISIDRKNRVVMVEPGVTYGDLVPKLKKEGLRLLLPLHPRETKSVLTSALEREPIVIPRYHWDSSDPLLCTEVIFGTGDLFRTGTAAGPGTVKQQKKSGQAQVNPMGPTQFSPFRLIQGAQGSLGVVTWASLKLELIPTIQKVFHIQSEQLEKVMDFQHELIKYRLCDEIFILNNINLACLVRNNPQDIENISKSLSKWNLIYIISGRGKLAQERIDYLESDIAGFNKEFKIEQLKGSSVIKEAEILKIINEPTSKPWRMRYKGRFQDIIFLSNFESVPNFISILESLYDGGLGIYIQPINQGTAHQCEFDIYYDIGDENNDSHIKEKFINISRKLMDSGAFFNRPYGLWAKEAYERHSNETIVALKKVKKIFDPNNILNPGVLCFDD